jgi:3-oxoadipate enol-lactonase
MAELLDAGVLPEGADVVGNGLGGFVALALAARHGPRFGKVVLIGTGAAFPPEGKPAFAVMRSAVLDEGMGGVVDAAMNRLFPEPYLEANPSIVDGRRKALLQTNPSGFAAACEALTVVDLGPLLASVPNPMLVMVGTEDRATPPELARVVAAGVPGAALVELDGLGHVPHVQEPGLVVDAIAPFLGL